MRLSLESAPRRRPLPARAPAVAFGRGACVASGMHRIVLGIVLLAGLSAPSVSADVKFVALPDTQIYSDNRFPGEGSVPVTDPAGTYRYFVDQTQWIADNAATLNIDFVVHLGDLVQGDDRTNEWIRAKAALDILDVADIPYGTAIGNHDTHVIGENRPYYETYVDNFGPQHFAGRPWYGGASPTGASNYQIVGDGQQDVLFLNLALSAPLVELEWADGVLLQHRDKLVVVTTHAYMYDLLLAAGRYGEPIPIFGTVAGDGLFNQFHGGAGKSAQEIYLEFLKSHPNIVMAQGGHFDADLYRVDGENGAGLPVLEIVSDYQGLRNGGDGYLRVYNFDFDNDRIDVETYSPTLDRYRTTFEHYVNSIYLIYKFRDDVGDALGVTPEVAFQLLANFFKQDDVPGQDIVLQHPEYLADPTFYDQLFSDLFLGSIPPEVGSIGDWEALWMSVFAVDRDNPTDYGPSFRSPAFSVDIDFDRYTDTTPATSKERTCITRMGSQVTRRGTLLGRRNKHTEKCIRDHARGKLTSTVDACINATSTRVTQSEAKSVEIEQRHCNAPGLPRFGVSSASSVNQISLTESLGMTEDVFGPEPRQLATIDSDRAAYRCQVQVARRSNALLETMLRDALKQATDALKSTTANNADLARGMLGRINDDPDQLIERFRSILGRNIQRHCHDSGVDISTALPGACADDGGDADELAACLETRARCRACRTMNGVHGSALSCDFFDDGQSVNLSCP